LTVRDTQVVDLSAPIAPSPPDAPPPMRVEIEYADHAAGAQQIEAMFGVPTRLLNRGEGWAIETITSLGTHNSTHVDAPWHYNSVVAGEPAQTIDQLPLEWFFGPGVCLDFTQKRDGDAVTRAEMERALDAAGHRLQPSTSCSCGPDATRSTTAWTIRRSGAASRRRRRCGCGSRACG
jgi:kynurenine formamidase